METNKKQIVKQISELFASQTLAVLSTQKDNQPYSSLIAFSVNDDLGHLYFLTPDTTRKYDNLVSNPQVSILVNDSRNQADDIYNAIAVTGVGVSEVIDKSKEKEALDHYLEKHPHLKDFSIAPTTAFIRIVMKRYFMVSRFQNVVEVTVNS